MIKEIKKIWNKEATAKDKWLLFLKTIGTIFCAGFVGLFIFISIFLIFVGAEKKHRDDLAQQNAEMCQTASDLVVDTNITSSKSMEKNAKSIFNFLVGTAKATPEAACGILGVWQFESQLNPSAINASSGATGVAQWLGARLVTLRTMAEKEGKAVNDLGVQMKLFWKEMNDPYYKNQGSLKILKEKDVHKATKDFLIIFEGMSQNPEQWFLESNGQGGAGRYAMADRWYTKFKGNKIEQSIMDSATNAGNEQADIVCAGLNDSWREEVIRVAKTQSKTKYFMGNPQVWGERLDCSGFVQGVYKRATNISLGRTTVQQEKDFKIIDKEQAKAGDVCFWGDKGNTHHVAIYDGKDGVYEMKDEKYNWQHTPLKDYYGGQPDFFGTIEGTKLGEHLVSNAPAMGGKWRWPSPSNGTFAEYQDFGPRNYAPAPWHDGLDFGSANWQSPKILACHAGTVVFAGDPASRGLDNSYPNGLGRAVVVIKDGDLNMVYQEFSTTTSSIRVKVGDKVQAGQWIATRNTQHMHLGMTKHDWVSAQAKYLTDDGTWLDPEKIIRDGMRGKK